MIIFDLICPLEHRFEGWFDSAAGFESQQARGLVTCPRCESTEVRRVPSATHIGKSLKSPALKPTVEASPPASGENAAASLAAAIEVVQRLIPIVMAECEDVGERFPEEARKIHYAEAPERPIRGEASFREFEELREEGIEVIALPKLKTRDVM